VDAQHGVDQKVAITLIPRSWACSKKVSALATYQSEWRPLPAVSRLDHDRSMRTVSAPADLAMSSSRSKSATELSLHSG